MLATSRFNRHDPRETPRDWDPYWSTAHDVESHVVVRIFAAAMRGIFAEAFRLGRFRKILMPVFRPRQTSLVGPWGLDLRRGFRSWDAVST